MGRIFITPLAKKLASLNSINIKDITGTGPRGRITKIDIEKHLKLSSFNTNNEQKNAQGFVYYTIYSCGCDGSTSTCSSTNNNISALEAVVTIR